MAECSIQVAGTLVFLKVKCVTTEMKHFVAAPASKLYSPSVRGVARCRRRGNFKQMFPTENTLKIQFNYDSKTNAVWK